MSYESPAIRYQKKEKLLFHLLENFNQQFRSKFPFRKQLLLSARNEYNVEKFVCTSIKPTKMKYSELFDIHKCAQFVADFVTYEQLANPVTLPCQLKSPDYVLRSQIGTCFEISTLLVSLLIGNGYNAYVVSGYATKQCCENDQTYTPCPHHLYRQFDQLFRKLESAQPDIFDHEDDLGQSRFWKMFEQRKKNAEYEKSQLQEEADRRQIQKLEQIPYDHLHGNRIHSWVLLIDNQSVKFIEPTTGVIHEQTNDRYLTIESVWNNENYWINMKPTITCKDLSFDLSDLQSWEHFLVCEPWSVYVQNMKFDQKNDILALKHFRIMPSWVNDLQLSEDKFQNRFPNGHCTVYYRKTKYERFNKGYNYDGMISCLTIFNDYGCTETKAILKIFSERTDKLDTIKVDSQSGRVIEEFHYGRTDMMKRLEYFKNEKFFWNNLKLEFFDTERLDSLTSFSSTRLQAQINFRNRLDHRISYTVYFDTNTNFEDISNAKDSIIKIVEKFSKNNTYDIDTREYTPDQIFVINHYKNDEIFQKRRRYRKPICVFCEIKLTLQCECKLNMKFHNKQHETEYSKLIEMEQNCVNDIRIILNEFQEIQELRQTERNFKL